MVTLLWLCSFYQEKQRNLQIFIFSVLVFSSFLYWSYYLRFPTLPPPILSKRIYNLDRYVRLLSNHSNWYVHYCTRIATKKKKKKREEKLMIISLSNFQSFLQFSQVMYYFTILVMCKCSLCIATKCSILYFW